MTRHLRALALVVLLTLLATLAQPLQATHGSTPPPDPLMATYGTDSPTDAWAYLKLENAGQHFDINYVPVRPDYSAATLMGFVVNSGVWGGADFYGEDTFYIFRTIVRSDVDVTIPLTLGGDDGHSVYVDGTFQGGGGFGTNVDFDLQLRAGMPVQLELAGYNAEGPWVFLLFRRDNHQPITSTPGVTITADNTHSAQIDVRPYNPRNPIYLSQQGVIPVAILSTDTFDATSVDPASVCFGDAEDPAQRDCSGSLQTNTPQDTNGDGLVDLILAFQKRDVGIDYGDTQACLTGATVGGQPITGCDAIRILSPAPNE